MNLEKINQQLGTLQQKVKNIFVDNNIYWGAIDIRTSENIYIDEIDDFMPTGLRFCFSNHGRLLTIPFSVLEEINKLGDFTMTLKQHGADFTKPLYLYLELDYTDNQMLTL